VFGIPLASDAAAGLLRWHNLTQRTPITPRSPESTDLSTAAPPGFFFGRLFLAILSHEGYGTKDQNNLALANGHEARKRIAARQTDNDPYRFAEKQVHVDSTNLRTVVGQGVKFLDDVISLVGDTGHTYVYDNYLVGGNCGKAYMFSFQHQRYRLVEIRTGVKCM
jgi:hypothetical protein